MVNSGVVVPDGNGILKGSQSRGYRNNNPLNIRYSASNAWKGQIGYDDNKFAKFDSVVNGLRAAYINLRTYYNGKKLRTIRQIIYTWAPVADNNPHNENYVNHVASVAGVNSGTELTFNFETYSKIVKAMSQFESNYTPTDSELKQAWDKI